MRFRWALVPGLMIPALSSAAELGDVVVTAPTMSDPFTVEMDPRAPRQPVPAGDGADFLKSVPGFSVIRKGGTSGDPLLRGLGGSRLNILDDGAAVLGGCPQRMDPPTSYIYPESYDKVTVVKGPQTVLYGGGNLAGTVLFERRTERFEEAGTRFIGSVLAGSYGRNDQLVDVTAGAPEGFVRAIGTRSASDNYEDGGGTEVHSEYERWSGTAIAGWTPSARTRLELTYGRSDGEAAYGDRPMDATAFDRESYSAKYEQSDISPLVGKFSAEVYHSYIDHLMDNFTLREPGLMPGMMMPMKVVSNPDRETDGARLSTELNLGDATFATIGADYQSDDHSGRKVGVPLSAADPQPDSAPRVSDMSFDRVGVFAEVEHQLDLDNSLSVGLRADRVTATAESDVGGVAAGTEDEDTNRAGFVRLEHLVSAGRTLYVGLGHAERSPDYWERKAVFELEAEKSNQLDLGMSYRAEGFAANVAAFYNNIDDFILISSVGEGTRNVDATTYGLEADAVYALGSNWKTTGTLAYVWGENRTDERALPQMPPLEGTLAIDYDNRTWSAGLLLRAVAEQDRVDIGSGNIAGTDIDETPGFAVLSANGGYRMSDGVKLTAGVDNLFDRTYTEHVNRAGADIAGFEQTDRVNEPGRSYWAKLTARF